MKEKEEGEENECNNSGTEEQRRNGGGVQLSQMIGLEYVMIECDGVLGADIMQIGGRG